jgi:hypothetical protein
MPQTGFVGVSNWGCLLPLLIIFNLIFGRLIFNSNVLWLGLEALLVLIFMLKVRFMVSKISQQFSQAGFSKQRKRPLEKVIDVQGQEVEDEQRLN